MPADQLIGSIHELTPTEFGGIVARQGFDYQDHISAHLCLCMAKDSTLKEVWCESMDDSTLIWGESPDQVVEFVQVKSNQLDQLWTVAKLCAQDTDRVGRTNGQDGDTPRRPRSILEKSLAHDRCTEQTRFRIVTQWPVHSQLRLLTWPLGEPARASTSETYIALRDDLSSKPAAAFRSERGHDFEYWLQNTFWDVKGKLRSVQNENLLVIQDLASEMGHILGPDLRQEIYQRLLSLVKDMSTTSWLPNPAAKKLSQSRFLEWIETQITRPDPAMFDKPMTRKMSNASISPDMVSAASTLRLRYLRSRRAAQYLSLEQRQEVEVALTSRLMRLRSQLYSQVIEMDGSQFHNECLGAIDELYETWDPATRPELMFLQGCMYEMTNRCLHRFDRPST